MCLYTCLEASKNEPCWCGIQENYFKKVCVGTDSTPRSFYAYLILNIADNFSVVYSKRALQPVFQEIMDAAYDPQVQAYVIKNEFNVTFDELQPLISLI